jgi:hypothetical protein
MEKTTSKCLKCGGEMNEGFVFNQAGMQTGVRNVWHPGEPQFKFFAGLKVEKNKLRPITTYRCDQCGYLECYAY